jgi:hypothetical protein
VLAVDFHDFYAKIFMDLYFFLIKIMLKLFNPTSFGDYLIPGAHYINFGQKIQTGTEANTYQTSPAGPQTLIQSTMIGTSSSKIFYSQKA